jgi:hypothetical protein
VKGKAMTTFTVTNEVSEERVRDLLCSAWEGGSAYWCTMKDRKVPKAAAAIIEKERSERGEFYGHEYPFIPGVKVILTDASGEDTSDCPEPWVLTRKKLVDGLQVMATKYPRHFANFLNEDDDAETGGVYLQCCLFGDIIFG